MSSILSATTFCLFLLHGFLVKSQNVKVNFFPVIQNLEMKEGVEYIFGKDSIQIDMLKWYISGIELKKDNKSVWKETNSFHLIDISNKRSLVFELKPPDGIDFDKIKFNLGIDSLTNVSGAMGGDLDPTLGMYWTWQSGYINFKMEGKSNRSPNPHQIFEFHLGGYHFPYNAIREITLDVANKNAINIHTDLSRFIEKIDLSKINRVMSPGTEAMKLSDLAARIFSIR